MWGLIRKNRRKSMFLFMLMGLCLVLLGYFIGMAVFPPDGGYYGIAATVALWILWSIVAYFQGDTILLGISGAREVSHNIHPQLFNIVEEMKIAAALPVMPKVYIMNEDAPNAFAVGRTPERSAVAVTTGLLEALDRDELQGVVAHEISHISNRDVLFMTFAGIMLGSIVIIGNGFLRAMWYGGASSRRFNSNSKGGGQAQLAFLAIALIFAIFAPILAQLLYFAISRKREYLADASAVRLTRYPEGLASALERISTSTLDLPNANQATAPMYFVNPLKKQGRALTDVTSTHPPITERIQILRVMSKGAGLFRYQQAFNRVKGKLSPLVPESALKDAEVIPFRKARSMGAGAAGAAAPSKRDINDLKRAVNRFIFLTCASCSLKIKLPPDWKKPTFSCPRCKHEISMPAVKLAAVAGVLEGLPTTGGAQSATAAAKEAGPQSHGLYKRKSQGWESFECDCGHKINLSPIFAGSTITCKGCKRKILIDKDVG